MRAETRDDQKILTTVFVACRQLRGQPYTSTPMNAAALGVPAVHEVDSDVISIQVVLRLQEQEYGGNRYASR